MMMYVNQKFIWNVDALAWVDIPSNLYSFVNMKPVYFHIVWTGTQIPLGDDCYLPPWEATNQHVVNFTFRQFFYAILGCFSGACSWASQFSSWNVNRSMCYLLFLPDVEYHIRLPRRRCERYCCKKVCCVHCIWNLWVLIAHPLSKCRTKLSFQLEYPLHFFYSRIRLCHHLLCGL